MAWALRSLVAFTGLALSFVLLGGFQRFFLWPIFLVRPSLRDPVMDRFMYAVAGWVLFLVRVGGARVRRKGTVHNDGPVLILMNHQSLLDIPTAIRMCRPHVPAFVTRKLYGRHVPMVSGMLRIRRYPLVEPYEDPRGSVATLRRAAQLHRHGIVLFPEGHRTRNGEIDPFETAGLRVLLGQRPLAVYVIVTEGFWVCRTLREFVFNMRRIDGRTEVLGPFEVPASAAAFPAFIETMRDTMVAQLERMRGAAA